MLMPEIRIKCFVLFILSFTYTVIKLAGINDKAIAIKKITARLFPKDFDSLKS